MMRQKMIQTLQNMAYPFQMQSCLIGIQPLATLTVERIMARKGLLH